MTNFDCTNEAEHRDWWGQATDIPYGKCWCGCGLPTPQARKSRAVRYHLKGFPVRYLHGHGGRRKDLDEEGRLQCSRCGLFKGAEENFYINGHRKNLPHARKFHTTCKSCILSQARMRKYNLSIEQYEQMYLDQDGRCSICTEEGDLVVDHDHGTGLVRGLLCSDCNLGIGKLMDDPQRLRMAARYLSPSPTPVLDHGYIELIEALGGDLAVVNSARVSFNRSSQFLAQGDDRLIDFLMKNRHGTPFESSVFTFRIKAPIFVVREWQRHRIGSFNEWSGRYSKMEPEFYIPEQFRTQVGKPGDYQFTVIEDELQNKLFAGSLEMANVHAWDTYEYLIKEGVAKELARLGLPLNLYTQMYWTINARSLMNFLSLRDNENAMQEIREYAQALDEIWSALMPVTWAAFHYNGKVAP